MKDYFFPLLLLITKKNITRGELMSLNKAYSHIIKELQLGNLKESLKVKYDEVWRSHDAIHEFMLLAPKMFPFPKGPSWHTRSAFLLYHSETFNTAHRSLIEALCSYYNVSFILLRSVLELLLKGAFFECLAHKDFRKDAPVLSKDKRGKNLLEWLNEIVKRAPAIEDEFEKMSGGIYDKIAPIVDDQNFRPSIPTIIKQLAYWEILDPIKNAHQPIWNLYRMLSKDVHVIPDRTDVGKILLIKPEELFVRKKVFPHLLDEYLECLKEVMDIGIVIELNILKDNLRYSEVRENLKERLYYLEELELPHGVKRVRSLIL